MSDEIDRLRREAEKIIELVASLKQLAPNEVYSQMLDEIKDGKLKIVYSQIDERLELEAKAKRSTTLKEVLDETHATHLIVKNHLDLDDKFEGWKRSRLPLAVRQLIDEAVMSRPERGEASVVTHRVYRKYVTEQKIDPKKYPFETVRSYVYKALKAYMRGTYCFRPD